MGDDLEGAARPLRVRHLGRMDYVRVWRAMQAFAAGRDAGTADELWLVEHPPVFTLGRGGRGQRVADPGDIPVVPVDRGGLTTYHGPGQVVAYVLIDLARRGLGVGPLVRRLENAVADVLAGHGLTAGRRAGAPGIYVGRAKVASVGLRVRRGCSYHGMSLNVAMDLRPFQRIDPCGVPGLAVTDLGRLGVSADPAAVAGRLAGAVAVGLGYPGTVTGPPGLPAAGDGTLQWPQWPETRHSQEVHR